MTSQDAVLWLGRILMSCLPLSPFPLNPACCLYAGIIISVLLYSACLPVCSNFIYCTLHIIYCFLCNSVTIT